MSLCFPAFGCKTAPDSRLAGTVPPPYHPPNQGRGFEVRNVFDIRLRANFETKTTLESNKLPVSFDSEIRLEPDLKFSRISESGHRPRATLFKSRN